MMRTWLIVGVKRTVWPVARMLLVSVGAAILVPNYARAAVFLASDWDSGNPPTGWPCKNAPTQQCSESASFYGWTSPLGAYCDSGYNAYWAETGVSQLRAYSGGRSLYMNRAAGQHSTCDIRHDLPAPYATRIHIRFRLYLDSNYINFNTPVSRFPFAHFLFTNSALSGTGFRVNLLSGVPWGSRSCGHGIGGIAADQPYMFFSCENNADQCTTGAPSPCYNLLEHLDRWQCVEFMFDAVDKKYNVWIDGTKYVDDVTVPMSQSNFTMIQFSGWVSDEDGAGFDASYYLDDIVVSDSYVGCGPVGGGDMLAPAAPSNLTVQ